MTANFAYTLRRLVLCAAPFMLVFGLASAPDDRLDVKLMRPRVDFVRRIIVANVGNLFELSHEKRL